MVKDHSDSERGNPLLPHGLLFPISSKGSFICTIPDRIAHTTAFVTPVVEDWLEREIECGKKTMHCSKHTATDPYYQQVSRDSYLFEPLSPVLNIIKTV